MILNMDILKSIRPDSCPPSAVCANYNITVTSSVASPRLDGSPLAVTSTSTQVPFSESRLSAFTSFQPSLSRSLDFKSQSTDSPKYNSEQKAPTYDHSINAMDLKSSRIDTKRAFDPKTPFDMTNPLDIKKNTVDIKAPGLGLTTPPPLPAPPSRSIMETFRGPPPGFPLYTPSLLTGYPDLPLPPGLPGLCEYILTTSWHVNFFSISGVMCRKLMICWFQLHRRWFPMGKLIHMSPLVQFIVCYLQATSHNLNGCWPGPMTLHHWI